TTTNAKEVNITRATIIIDSQITSCDEIEDELPNSDKIPKMKPKLIDLQTLTSNNLSNLEAEEGEDIISSLSDVDNDALLGQTLKPKGLKPTFCECHVNKTLPIESSMLKNSLNLVFQHKFGEAALERIPSFVGYHSSQRPLHMSHSSTGDWDKRNFALLLLHSMYIVVCSDENKNWYI
uniref:Uncharacterized protein n=1 Tax=Romanomermis culicivorax TaxID=13658 RepID=A0A915HKI3_ROMCU